MTKLLQGNEFIAGQPSLPDDLAECAFGNISWMIGDHDAPVGLGMVPNLVTAFGLAIKHKAGFPKFADNIGRSQRRQFITHAATGMAI